VGREKKCPAGHAMMPVEEAVTLLAIHCLARHQASDAPGFWHDGRGGPRLFDGIAKRATRLIQSCSVTSLPGFPLSPRQREVLTNISQNLSNMEIAAKLNVSVRTIKFHVSTLLEKFDVKGRVDLMLESAPFLPVDRVHKRVSHLEPIALSRVRPIPLLPSSATKVLLATPVDRRAVMIGIGKRAPRCTSEPSSSITSP
jgi:DNA-binding CsgD family transcriptional regulator